jgi:predicted TIM-barrel fold metal-dependent hydrolase
LENLMQRRTLLKAILPMAAAARQLSAQPEISWGGPVLDTHLHIRGDADACFKHMQGCGVTHAVLLSRVNDQERAKAEMEKRKGAFVRSVSLDPAPPGSGKVLRDALKNGAVSIGELKFHLALDSQEMRRVYDIAAEMHVPVMMHIQDFPHFPGELPYNTGYPQFDKILKAYPRTNFIGHGDLFWAHIAADVPTDRGYPAGPIRKGGFTDRWLSDFPNLYADMSANSGNNALSRDAEFSPGFLTRHKSKLIFGSDCSCSDGKGSGVSQNNNPEATRLAGKCVARATLGLLQGLTSPEIFKSITWQNGAKLFKVSAQQW